MAVPRYLQFAEQAPIATGAGLTGAFEGAQNMQQLMRNRQLMQQAPLDRQLKETQVKQAVGNLSLLPAQRRLVEANANLALMKAQHPERVMDSTIGKALSDKKRLLASGDKEGANTTQQYINGLIQKQQQQSIDPVTLAQQKQLIKDMSGSKKVTMQAANSATVLADTLNRLGLATNAIKEPWHRGGTVMYHAGAGLLPNDPDTKKPEGIGRKSARLWDNDWQTSNKDSNMAKIQMYNLVHTPGMRSNVALLNYINNSIPSADLTPKAFTKVLASWKAVTRQYMEKAKFMQASINKGVKDPLVIDNAWGDFLKAHPVVDDNGNSNTANISNWQSFVPSGKGITPSTKGIAYTSKTGKKYTEQDIQDTMRETGLSREEIIRKAGLK